MHRISPRRSGGLTWVDAHGHELLSAPRTPRKIEHIIVGADINDPKGPTSMTLCLGGDKFWHN